MVVGLKDPNFVVAFSFISAVRIILLPMISATKHRSSARRSWRCFLIYRAREKKICKAQKTVFQMRDLHFVNPRKFSERN